MLNIAKSKQGNLEQRLYELNRLSKNHKPTDLAKLIELLVYLNDEVNIDSKVYKEGQETQPNILYMLESHIEHCFDNNEMQIAPVSMLIQTSEPNLLVDTINQQHWFICEIKEWNGDKGHAHLVLHPLDVKQNAA